ncbi:Ceramide synthase 1 [Desmophyllum pertusum]|uniref:Ceramide synthase 1 n=1 Tax=Desmophyllum pertusum TaxID=174260 RepID=A0A9W9Y7S9_9CNID|nr:Ceramide synthase 1 [Desmophyllum pertusum]
MEVGYLEAFSKIWNHCWIEWEERGPRKTFLTDFINDVSSYGFISAKDILLCLVLGVVFTILRYFLTTAVFKPFFSWCQFIEKDQKKCPESAFKLLFYSSAYGYCCYILFKYNYLQDPSRNCWEGWYKGMPVPQDIYMLYLVEAGFYFHSIYATLFMDQWRRDSILMILHHILANCLILFSFAIRYHRIGILVLFLHDINDVSLEFTKLCLGFKSRGGKYHRIPDILSTTGFLTFAVLWFYCRLYLYPIKVLYTCGCGCRPYVPLTAPFYFFFNGMLWTLFFMNLWWFQFIVWLIIRIVCGKSPGVEDTREIPKKIRERW